MRNHYGCLDVFATLELQLLFLFFSFFGVYTEMQEHPGGEDEEKKNYIFLIEKKKK